MQNCWNKPNSNQLKPVLLSQFLMFSFKAGSSCNNDREIREHETAEMVIRAAITVIGA